MQSVSSRIWTRVAVSISYGNNHYTTGTSKSSKDIPNFAGRTETLNSLLPSIHNIHRAWQVFWTVSSVLTMLMYVSTRWSFLCLNSYEKVIYKFELTSPAVPNMPRVTGWVVRWEVYGFTDPVFKVCYFQELFSSKVTC